MNMHTQGNHKQSGASKINQFRVSPLAQAIAIALAAGSVTGDAYAQQAFSAAWYAQKGVVQAAAAATGKLPNGMPAMSASSPALQQQQANTQLQRSLANLNSAARAIALAQAQQSAARLAATGSVPDGLGVGGLDVGSLVNSWINANGPTQTTSNGKTIVDIKQTADKAILNWETFNIGKNTILQFDQQADWSVLNRINNATAPSVIQGQIKAPGTVMIVNANGIIFSGSSQVNTRNLVVAAAHILDSQFNTGIYSPNLNTASFTGANGNVLVEAGAQIATHDPSATVTAGGGYVLLLGKEVNNAGEIVTRKGQATLAAGDSFFIRKGVGTDGNTFSTTRGNEVAAKIDVGSDAGKVTNTGLIIAREGDITLTGRDVQQNGVAVATTTVNTRGTIHLLNSASDTQGNVTLGKDSVTAILIEDDGKTTALDSQRDALIKESAIQDASRINGANSSFDNLSVLADRRDQSRIEIVSGGDVHFAGDSLTLATGGQIAVSAKNRTFVADKSNLDVSGAVGVNVAMESNNVLVNVQGNELRDSPGNRDAGSLFNNNVWIDRRELILVPAGTGGYASDRWYAAGGLLEVSGYLSNQGHSIGEWAAQGGTLTLGGNEVITQLGSAINLSGGSFNVQTGMISQTWLKGSDGKLYRADLAPAGISYTGIYKGYEEKSERWGEKATKYYYNPIIAARQRLENGYTVGRDGGKLIINAPTAVMEGELITTVFNGERQIKTRDAISDGYRQAQTAVALNGQLAVGRYGINNGAGMFESDVRFGDVDDITAGMSADTALSPTRSGTVWFDSAYINALQLGGLDIATRETITVEQALTLASGGKLDFVAPVIDIKADITVRSGSIAMNNTFTAGTGRGSSEVLQKNGSSSITLREGMTLDTRGLWVNTLLNEADNGKLAYLNGGSVKLQSTNDVVLEKDSLIDVSSGAAVLPAGKSKGGRGGSVSLLADVPNGRTTLDGKLTLDGSIRAYGTDGGGALIVEAGQEIVLGGEAGVPGSSTSLHIDADLFRSGFSSYSINGHRGLTVAEDAIIDVLMPVYRRSADGLSAVTGSDPSSVLELWTPPLYKEDPRGGILTRRAGASLSLSAGQAAVDNGQAASLTIGKGSMLSVDPGQTINISGAAVGQMMIDGTLNAWGGAIKVNGTSFQDDGSLIWIGQNAVLDVAGRAYTALDMQGHRYGEVLNGGAISINAATMFVVVRDGALLNASGTSAMLDLVGRGAGNVASNGGAISFESSNGFDLGGSWLAKAGGTGAAGGSLAISLKVPFYSDITHPGNQPRDLVVTQLAPGSILAADATPASAADNMVYGHAVVGADQINAGGFDNLKLLSADVISFDGDVSLAMGQSLELQATSLALTDSARNDARVAISAPYVRLIGFADTGSTSSTRQSAAQFNVTTGLLDVQRSLQFGISSSKPGVSFDRRGFANVELQSSGDIRFLYSGSPAPTILQTRGDLVLAAQQIYPATGANAIVRAGWLRGLGGDAFYDPAYSLTIRGIGQAPAVQPFSAFGSLTLGAHTINQGGVIRAPLGSINLGNESGADTINLLPGSITSTSSRGLLMPYGGTVDGIDWYFAGKKSELEGAVSAARGVSLTGVKVDVMEGATIDLSGGGDLTGAGFVSGRGGSIDILLHALIDANPGNTVSKSGNAVYAIVPSHTSGYAPIGPDAGAGDPRVGQQITLDGSVPGLPAGTYTLMPSRYALLPGAFRVEIAATADPRGATGTTALQDGSYLAAGRLGFANTSIRDSLARQVILTPGKVTRSYSRYNETSYGNYALADAARRGLPRAMMPLDGQNLFLNIVPGAGADAFHFDGVVDFSAGKGGYAGSVSLLGENTGSEIEILASGATATAGFTGVSIYADDLNALSARRLTIGARPSVTYGQQGNYVQFESSSKSFDITLREGAILRAAEVLLITGWERETGPGAITIEAGAGISTLGMGATPFDSRDGFIYTPQRLQSRDGGAMLVVSNGWLDVLPSSAISQGAILIGACGASGNCDAKTTLYSEGTIAFATTNRFELGDNVLFGTRNLSLGVGAVNVGTSAALAAASTAGLLPSGLTLNQTVLDRLLQGDTSTGAPALESLILNATEAVNFFGTVTLDTYDAEGKSRIANLVFGTPAIYGAGDAADVATIRTENLVWSGTTGGPGAIIEGGAGTGSGALTIDAERITFGYGPKVQVKGADAAERLALGFANVNLKASERITANHKGSLAVYQSQGAYVAGTGYSYSGGDLNIVTPLLTGEAGSINSITAGGAIRVTAPTGATAAEVIGADGLGAELALNAKTVSVATAITLPSGRLTITATDDILLADAARLDLAGREVKFDDIKKYSWGGEVIIESRNGDIRQEAGSVIDLSAKFNHAGRLTVSALANDAGLVDLQGTILGTASGEYDAGGTIVPYRSGFIDLRAQHLGESGTLSQQFAGLNERLNAGGMFGGRGFQLKQGDLVIADGVRAGEVNVSLDGGHLTVTGTIDASGAEVGAIRLAARDGLTIAGSAVLDAHGERLRVDSYGKIIDSPNRAIVELTSGNGLLTLASGARIDLRHGTAAAAGSVPGQYDGAPRGTLVLNAPRLGGATAGDIAIDASGVIHIEGARSIAVNAMQRYDDAAYGTDPAASGRPYQIVNQDYLNEKHADSVNFITAALGNATLMDGKLAGLNNATYRDAFHLRPGVEIVSATPDGDIIVQGDLDLSGHRYEGVNPNFQRTGVYGSGEVGALTIRAGGNLDIYGSINDGFAPPPDTPDDDGWILRPGVSPFVDDVIVPRSGVTLADGTSYPGGRTLNYDFPVKEMTVAAGTRLPVDAVLNGSVTLPANTILAGDIRAEDGTLLHAAGTRLTAAVTLTSGTRLGAGFIASASLSLRAMVWPKGVPLPAGPFGEAPRLNGNLALPLGGLIPARADLKLPDGAISVPLRPVDANGRQGANWAVASMLPAGSQSWSMRFVAGADLAAADSRLLRPRDVSGNLTLADTHYSVFDRHEITIIPGTPAQPGGVWYWSEEGAALFGEQAGTRISDDWGPNGLCADAPSFCVFHTQSITAEGIAMWGLDVDWAGWGLSGPLRPGDPLPLGYEFFCEGVGLCVALGGPGTPGTPDQVIVGDLIEYIPLNPNFSVVRTGAADLDLIAGGNLAQRSLYGVYTAGTQSQGVTAAFDQARGVRRDDKVLGKEGVDYESLVSGDGRLSHAWYPTGGGNLLLRAGGDLTGDLMSLPSGSRPPNADSGNWLWRQGHAPGSDAGAAWWINFGTYVANDDYPYFEYSRIPYLVGFTGYGTLGGGDLRVEVGGDAGVVDRIAAVSRSQGLVLAVASTGRVNAQGDLALTGGGDLDVRIGGRLNPSFPGTAIDIGGSGGVLMPEPRLDGVIANLRGSVALNAASIGNIRLKFGPFANVQNPREERPYDPFTATAADSIGGPLLLPGDAVFTLATRGDLVVGGVIDGTRREISDQDLGKPAPAWFSLWSDRTAIDLFAAGGDLTPGNAKMLRPAANASDISYPSILRAVAPSGSLYAAQALLLAPSPNGQLEWLAGESIYGGVVSRSSADPAVLTTPFKPVTQATLDPGAFTDEYNLFAFGANTASGGYTLAPARFYALEGDIVGLMTGELQTGGWLQGQTLYSAGGAVWMKAGRDIINSGHNLDESAAVSTASSGGGRAKSNLFVHTSDTDVSIVSAGRDIRYSSFTVAGPGTLEISAGRNILLDDRASVTSLGAIVPGDKRPGASITMMSGMGNGVDWAAMRARYLDPAKLADPNRPLADQPGMAVKIYSRELSDWLGKRYGFVGTDEEALATFDGLAAEQQRIFLRDIYYAEIRESGREYNAPDSSRFASYLRGRETIATLFPETDKDGRAISRSGDIIMFGGSGVRTNFGGDIQMFAPAGKLVIGVEGQVPPASAGLVTQGTGNIQLYSEGSVLLGLSRIMTTFGGNIFAWSAEGDINAGRGAKTTVLYTPPKRVYDQWGNVTQSPQVPSSGAGIATLNPLPEVAAGDIDLIAPLGTIDAGEAGIRVSGNVNLAALQIVNAANIQVQGKSTGLPMIASVNVGALTNASAAASSAAAAAQDVLQRDRNEARKNLPSIFTVRVLGFGNDPVEGGASPAPANKRTPAEQAHYNPDSMFQMVGHGKLTSEQVTQLTENERRNLSQGK